VADHHGPREAGRPRMSFQREGSNRAPAAPSRLRRHAAGNRAFPVQTTSKVAAQWRQAYTRPGAPQPFMALIHVDTNVKICRDMPAKAGVPPGITCLHG